MMDVSLFVGFRVLLWVLDSFGIVSCLFGAFNNPKDPKGWLLPWCQRVDTMMDVDGLECSKYSQCLCKFTTLTSMCPMSVNQQYVCKSLKTSMQLFEN